MATDADRTHARRLIAKHQKNLRELELRAAGYAGDVPLSVVNQIDEERANIAALEPIAKPAPSTSVQAFVTGVSDGNGGNWAMMFSQFVLLNTRMTKQEEQTQRILDEQGMARLWRLQASSDIEELKADNADRVPRQRHNFWLLIAVVVMLALVLLALVLR